MSDTASPDSREGEVLVGKYKLMARLGAGGMGEVYRAENLLIGRTVAIKLLLPEHVRAKDLAERFLREARAAVIVHHPNVVDVLDIGEDPSAGPFIVQEFLEGEDLDNFLERNGGRLSLQQLADLVFPVIDAMALAHSRGVVHRDLKPSNVFLSRFGGKIVPKLLDFGISQVKSGTDNIRMTGTGMILGSPAYMSPEQIKRSRSVDARSDVWSLGVILYEVLSGSLPFNTDEADSVGALFIQIATVDVLPLKQTMPTVPTELARIVGRCLKRDPKERYPSATELLRDLKDSPLGASFPPATRQVGPPKTLEFQGDLAMPKPQPPPRAAMARLPVPEPEQPEAAPAAPKQTAARKATGQRPGLARPAMGDPLYDDDSGSIELDVGAPPALRATMIQQSRPEPRPNAAPPSRTEEPAQEAEEDVVLDEITNESTAKFAGIVLGVTVAFFIIIPVPHGFMKSLWSSPLLTGKMPLGTAAAGVIVGVLGAAIASVTSSKWKREWGPLVSAAGLVLTGLVLVFQALERWGESQAAPAEVSHTLPLTLSFVPLGLCVFASKKAWRNWRTSTSTGLVTTIGFAALFALGVVLVQTILYGG
jgi:eukaryotic-like serine/threonine-protein kinase